MLYDLYVASSIFIFSYFPFPTLFLTVGFMRPSGFKTLRQELPDSLTFTRRFAPLKVVHWGSQALCIIP